MALYIKHPNGLIALTGCGHSGVENIVEYGFQVTGLSRLYAIIGGLHFMGGLNEDRIRQVTNYLVNKSPSTVVGGTTVRAFLVLQLCTTLCQRHLGLVVLVP